VIRYHVGIEPSVGIPVRVTLYDAMGRLIRTLVDEQKTSGDYDLSISASDLAGGMYWYVLEAGGVTDSRSMIIAK
jgi:hypothetical protein